jgi:hypothetical protein
MMKIKEGFVIREIAGESVVLALGNASRTFNGMIKLNETARLLWERLAQGCEKEALISAILEQYDVEREIAERDVEHLIETLEGANILE